MLIQPIKKEKIVNDVMDKLNEAKKEILATMNLAEEVKYPLPDTYHLLIKQKADIGVTIKRIGFGTKEDYNRIKNQYNIKNKNYSFRLIEDINKYQRMLIIDEKIVFLGAEESFISSTNHAIISVIRDIFLQIEKKGKIL